MMAAFDIEKSGHITESTYITVIHRILTTPVRSPTGTGQDIHWCCSEKVVRVWQVVGVVVGIFAAIATVLIGLWKGNVFSPKHAPPSPPVPNSPNLIISVAPSFTPTVAPSFTPTVAPSPTPTLTQLPGPVWCATLQSGSVYLCAKATAESACYASVDKNSAIDFSTSNMYSAKYISQEDCISNTTCIPSGLNIDTSAPVFINECTFETCTINNAQVNCVVVDLSLPNTNCIASPNFFNCQSCIDYVGCDHGSSSSYCHAVCP